MGSRGGNAMRKENRSKKSVKGPGICLPEFPKEYYSRLNGERNNTFILMGEGSTRHIYQLGGWIKHALIGTEEREAEKKRAIQEVGLVIRHVNIRGRLISENSQSAPKRIHLRMKRGAQPTGTIDLKTGQATLKIPLELEYPELSRDPKRLIKSKGMMPYTKPLQTDFMVGVHYNLKKGGFTATGTGTFDSLTPYGKGLFPAVVILACLCDSKTYCHEMCLSIKVGSHANGNPILSRTEIDELINRINTIWGCATGQCCINFVLGEVITPMIPPLPGSVTIDESDYSQQHKDLIQMYRSSECYNIYIVNSIPGTIAGTTGYNDHSGIIIERSAWAAGMAEMGPALAHELGHALGLGRGTGTDPDGVTAHSSTADNVMRPTGNAANVKLNAKQCEEAQDSGFVKKTSNECTVSPLEV
jgi:hypothetical protein